MIRTVESVSSSIVITDTTGVKTSIPKIYVNISVPTSGTAVSLDTIGASYSIDYTVIEYPVATSRDDLADQLNAMI